MGSRIEERGENAKGMGDGRLVSKRSEAKNWWDANHYQNQNPNQFRFTCPRFEIPSDTLN